MEAEETATHDIDEDELIECLTAFKEDPPLAVSRPRSTEKSTRPLSGDQEARCREPLGNTSSSLGDRVSSCLLEREGKKKKKKKKGVNSLQLQRI